MGPKTQKRIDELKQLREKLLRDGEHSASIRVQHRIDRLFSGLPEEESLGGHRNRPYLGQSWQISGEAGKRYVPKMTLRDLGDTINDVLQAEGFSTEHINRMIQTIIDKLG